MKGEGQGCEGRGSRQWHLHDGGYLRGGYYPAEATPDWLRVFPAQLASHGMPSSRLAPEAMQRPRDSGQRLPSTAATANRSRLWRADRAPDPRRRPPPCRGCGRGRCPHPHPIQQWSAGGDGSPVQRSLDGQATQADLEGTREGPTEPPPPPRGLPLSPRVAPGSGCRSAGEGGGVEDSGGVGWVGGEGCCEGNRPPRRICGGTVWDKVFGFGRSCSHLRWPAWVAAGAEGVAVGLRGLKTRMQPCMLAFLLPGDGWEEDRGGGGRRRVGRSVRVTAAGTSDSSREGQSHAVLEGLGGLELDRDEPGRSSGAWFRCARRK